MRGVRKSWAHEQAKYKLCGNGDIVPCLKKYFMTTIKIDWHNCKISSIFYCELSSNRSAAECERLERQRAS